MYWLVWLCLSSEVSLTMNVRFKWFLAVLLALCLGVPSSGWASSDIKKIVLATDTIDGLVEKDGSGLYVDMLTKIFAAQSIELNIMIVIIETISISKPIITGLEIVFNL